ncbi:superoxide dismutase [Candidatus Uhrbacteria bacterium]|nr:superoxide dismutase [Candidatus Uhrbacteria bacterium]
MYQAKNFEHLLGTPGFSDTLLKNHFALYDGYVKNCNLIHDRFGELKATDKIGSLDWAELKRRSAWEYNGMRLHELYFGNMKNGGVALSEGANLHAQLMEKYGTIAAWEKDFRATGAMRGIGWAVLMYDKEAKCFRNSWVNEHDVGFCVGMTNLLIMDVFEHAYITDYGIKRADYIEAFMKAIDWSVVEQRFAS